MWKRIQEILGIAECNFSVMIGWKGDEELEHSWKVCYANESKACTYAHSYLFALTQKQFNLEE